jgi:hypothetical protein
MSNSVSNMPVAEQRKYLSEQVRIAHLKYIALDDNAGRLEDGRKILLSEMELNLVDSGECSSISRAEKVAITSEQYKGYMRKMHDARREANDARAELSALERDYWATVSDEASERQQMRMARG